MNCTVEITFKARQELAKASGWYDEKQPGLGEQFEQDVFRKINLVQCIPFVFPDFYRSSFADGEAR